MIPWGDTSRTTLVQAREALLARRFGIHYRPILDTRSGELIGHCASARFAGTDDRGLPAAEVFAALHEQPALLCYVEIESSAWRRPTRRGPKPGARHRANRWP